MLRAALIVLLLQYGLAVRPEEEDDDDDDEFSPNRSQGHGRNSSTISSLLQKGDGARASRRPGIFSETMAAFQSLEEGVSDTVELAIKAYSLTSGGVCPQHLPVIPSFNSEPAYEYGIGCLLKDERGQELCRCPNYLIYTCHDEPWDLAVVSGITGYLVRNFGYCRVPTWILVVSGLLGFSCLCGMCCCAYRSISSDFEEQSLEERKARQLVQRDQLNSQSSATQPIQADVRNYQNPKPIQTGDSQPSEASPQYYQAAGTQPTQAQAQYYQGDQYFPQPDPTQSFQAPTQNSDIDPFLAQTPTAQPLQAEAHDLASAAQSSEVQRQGSLPPPLPPS